MKNIRRKIRTRHKIKGTADIPRVSVERTLKHIYVQLIDDDKGIVLEKATDFEIKKKAKKVELAKEVGLLIAKRALEKKIKKVVFDRSGYKYHGRVKELAEAARKGGLEF